MSTSVVSGVDASPVLQACEQVFYPVTLAVEDGIVGVLGAVTRMWRNARCDAALDERLAEGGGTVGSVGQQVVGRRQGLNHCSSGLVIIGLSFAQMQQQRASLAIADHLQLGGQAASTASDTSG